ncbi:hypothetical protein [Actinoplanes subtropicus]|uniref:hypothetical protein n=1 Tax=Actinoplanes subtropicus TaxID=543632 RepID=UPI0004C2E60C|nr:hypothetical protein [Actinoplanes subtropicus]
MNLDESQAMAGLETALNEAEVLGLRAAPSDLAGELLLHVCAQPEDGSPDPDPRRILRLLNATRLRVLLREERPDGYGPAIPLNRSDSGRWRTRARRAVHRRGPAVVGCPVRPQRPIAAAAAATGERAIVAHTGTAPADDDGRRLTDVDQPGGGRSA